MNIRDYKKILFYVMFPLFLGGLVGILNINGFNNYDGILSGWIFPVVWTILYILMGYSSYLISGNKRLFSIYIINLIVNLLWTFIFFMFDFKVFAFFWILFLIIIVSIMIYEFYRVDKLSGYLLIPYILWLLFAAILNLIEII